MAHSQHDHQTSDSLQGPAGRPARHLARDRPASEARLRGLHQHLRGLQHSANDLDAQLADGTRWALLHDLHLRIDGRSLWIDHLLINRQLDILLLASPHYGDSLSVDEQGEFFREVRGRRLGFASPLNRLHRQLALLRTWSRQLAWPYRQGGPLTPAGCLPCCWRPMPTAKRLPYLPSCWCAHTS